MQKAIDTVKQQNKEMQNITARKDGGNFFLFGGGEAGIGVVLFNV